MTLIYVLLVAHFIADFVAQSDWMALNKGKRWDALALHVTVYSLWTMLIVSAAIAFRLLPADAYRNVAVWIGVNAAAHFAQDALTSRITSRLWFLILTPSGETSRIYRDGATLREEPMYFLRDTGTRHWFFVAIGADQLLHYVTLFTTAGWWLQ